MTKVRFTPARPVVGVALVVRPAGPGPHDPYIRYTMLVSGCIECRGLYAPAQPGRSPTAGPPLASPAGRQRAAAGESDRRAGPGIRGEFAYFGNSAPNRLTAARLSAKV